ncbi:MAG TPA: sodium:calcium antiporter, partial [Woeseiaceae bacterium]
LLAALSLLVAMAVVIAFAGTAMAKTVDRLADRTGLGEALSGVLLLAAATSVPDFAATLSASLDGRPVLAISNVTGSMAANLVFLVIADAFYRKANLEHAAASGAILMQAALFIALLSLPLIAATTPAVSLWGMHPVTPIIVVAYVFGLRLVHGAQETPMWLPRETPQTADDEPDKANRHLSLRKLWVQFALLTAVTGVAGWLIMEAAKSLTDLTGLDEDIAGGLLTAVATSLPELVTTVAAVRHGALTLAVSNIFGTNAFNVVVVAVADGSFREGSIYHAISPSQIAWGVIVILMTAVLLLGLISRQKFGIGRIGFESVLVLILYGLGLTLLAI